VITPYTENAQGCPQGGGVVMYVEGDHSGCPGSNVTYTITWSYSLASSPCANPPGSGAISFGPQTFTVTTSSTSDVGLASVGASYGFHCDIAVSVAPYQNDGCPPSQYFEVYPPVYLGPNAGGLVNTYSPYPQGCRNPNSYTGIMVNYTNNTAAPVVDPSGQVLLPGQGETFMGQYPQGQSNNFTFSTFNPETGGYTGQTGGWSINGNGTYATNPFVYLPGENADDLASSNGGSIMWTPDMGTNLNLLNEAGFQAVAENQMNQQQQENQNFSNMIAALQNLHLPAPTNTSGGVASNVWVQNWPTNFGNGSPATNIFNGSSNVWVQNWPTNIDTNTALGLVWGNTNQAANDVQGISQQAGTLEGMVPGSLADNNGSPEEQDIIITPSGAQQQVTIAMGVLPSTLSTTFSQIRGVIGWFVVVFLAIWNFKSMFDTIKDVSMVPQGQGPDTGAWAALGSNIVTALVVASAIVAVISVIPVFAVGLLAGELSFASNYSGSSPLNFFNQMGWGFQFLSQYLPIYLMFTAFGVRVLFYFGLEVLAVFACFVIKLLIGV